MVSRYIRYADIHCRRTCLTQVLLAQYHVSIQKRSQSEVERGADAWCRRSLRDGVDVMHRPWGMKHVLHFGERLTHRAGPGTEFTVAVGVQQPKFRRPVGGRAMHAHTMVSLRQIRHHAMPGTLRRMDSADSKPLAQGA